MQSNEQNSTVFTNEFDSQWKVILEKFFWQFLDFFFPDIAQELDASITPDFLDTELAALVPQSQTKTRHADKLVRVCVKDGATRIVFIHVEVQAQHDLDFAERMYIYNTRIYDTQKLPVVSLAILIDKSSQWRPNTFSRNAHPSILHSHPGYLGELAKTR